MQLGKCPPHSYTPFYFGNRLTINFICSDIELCATAQCVSHHMKSINVARRFKQNNYILWNFQCINSERREKNGLHFYTHERYAKAWQLFETSNNPFRMSVSYDKRFKCAKLIQTYFKMSGESSVYKFKLQIHIHIVWMSIAFYPWM